jgi:predicted MPP superfamily phosphohydrolase
MAGLLSWPLQDGWVRIEHRDMPLPNLPRQLVGARLVHLSDLHYGPFVRAAHLHRYVELVNSMRPDIVALPTQCRHFVGGQYSLGHGRFLYVNRGLSNAMRYRPHHKPEITVFSLCRAGSRSGASDRGEGGTVWKQARHSTSCSADASMSEGGQP